MLAHACIASRPRPPPLPPAGLIIEFLDPHSGARRTATFLPEVAAHEGWDRQQTLDHLIRKAGHSGSPLAVRASATLKVTRYVSTTCSLSWEEFRALQEQEAGGGAAPRGDGAAVKLRKQRELVAVSAGQ